jgi:antitoxin (DNA-binding transcriptional repressor) of toxin-antitoxin stability system
MKTITIRELHTHTGWCVREAARRPIVVTDRGEIVAVLQAANAAQLSGRRFPKRDRSKLPMVDADSVRLISDDRER